ncbi:HNH endonuclease [Salinigranum sp. GCM10025319]|uniref:HNH endonuclease n=1 Tax=Salinigranum sp. GCM10025319 TaxID=3252687 RepID=UPI0036160441
MDCPTCDKTLRTRSGVRQHHSKVHDDPLPNRTCRGCDENFYDPKSRREYCDECNPNAGSNNGNWKGGKQAATCRICDDRFDYYPSDKDGTYCPDCVEEADGLLPENPARPAERVSTRCEHCERELEVRQERIDGNSYGVFCSSSCYARWLSIHIVAENHHQWKGGTLNYGSGWWETRRNALKRDGYQCRRCGIAAEELGQNPDVHHVTPVREFENPEEAHSLANVVSLCRSCHRIVEEGGSHPS